MTTDNGTVCGEWKRLRGEMGYSMGEMAELLGIYKGTYQGYESGRRPAPAELTNQMHYWQQQGVIFLAGMAGRIDEQIKKDGGIVPNVAEVWE